MNQQINDHDKNMLINRFLEFKKTMQRRDPDKIIKDMIYSGQISQAEYQQAVEKAKELSQLLKLR